MFALRGFHIGGGTLDCNVVNQLRFPTAFRVRAGESVGAWSIPSGDRRRRNEADRMAKQLSANDPVSAAMSAIESALNLGESDALASAEGAAPVPPLAPRKPAAARPVLKPGVPPAEPAPLLRPGATPLPSGAEAEAKPTIAPSPPANDDRETVGAILQAMNVRPPSR